MKIEWKNIDKNNGKIVEEWLSENDKHNLCMEDKGWLKTANDIGECFLTMDDSQFMNVIGFINNKPAIALMFGVEKIKVLNIYNIIVNPMLRNLGIAKEVISELVSHDSGLEIVRPYNRVRLSTLPDNTKMHGLLSKLDFKNLGFDGEYIIFEGAEIIENERD